MSDQNVIFNGTNEKAVVRNKNSEADTELKGILGIVITASTTLG